MKRAELLALAERLETYQADVNDLPAAAAILRQIAEAKPVLWIANDFIYHEAAHVPNEWRAEVRVLSELPLED